MNNNLNLIDKIKNIAKIKDIIKDINTKKNTYSENVKQIEIYNEVYKSIYQILINHYDNIIKIYTEL